MTNTNLIGHGIKGRKVLERWQENQWDELVCLIIEDTTQTRNLEYLLENYFSDLINGINFTLKENNIDKCTIYLSKSYSNYLENFKETPIDVIIVDKEKKFTKSVFDGNTLVHNAETFVAINRPNSEENFIQKKIITIEGEVNSQGIFEIPFDTSINDIIEKYGKGLKEGKNIKFVQIGGDIGTVLLKEELDKKLNYSELIEYGTIFGTGKLEVFCEDTCAVEWAMNKILDNSKKSCGKCVLCREGFYQIYKILKDATQGKTKNFDMDFITELCEKIQIGTLCDYGKTAANPVHTIVQKFKDEFDQHMERKKCPTLSCNSYINFYINAETCDGCGECISHCEHQAIKGGEKLIHLIDIDMCEKCGKCESVCHNKSIKRYGAIKPKIPTEPIPVGTFKSESSEKKGLGVKKRRRRSS